MDLETSAVAVVVAAGLSFAATRLDVPSRHNINYDRSKQWTAKAVVTEFKYLNPHAQLFFDVTHEKGKHHALERRVAAESATTEKRGRARDRPRQCNAAPRLS